MVKEELVDKAINDLKDMVDYLPDAGQVRLLEIADLISNMWDEIEEVSWQGEFDE